MPETRTSISQWGVREIMDNFDTPDPTRSWTEVIQDLWLDRSSRQRVVALANDIIQRGEIMIPIIAEHTPLQKPRIVKGTHRIAAALATCMNVPVELRMEVEQ